MAELTHTGNSHEWRDRRGERAAVRLSHSRALTGSLLTQHRPPPDPSSPFPHADSSTISSSFGPARSIASPRRLQLRLRAPRTHTAVGGISGRGRGRPRQSPQRRGGAESLASLRSLWHKEVRIGSARGSPALCLSAVEPLLPAYPRGRLPGRSPHPSTSSAHARAQIRQGSHPSPH